MVKVKYMENILWAGIHQKPEDIPVDVATNKERRYNNWVVSPSLLDVLNFLLSHLWKKCFPQLSPQSRVVPIPKSTSTTNTHSKSTPCFYTQYIYISEVRLRPDYLERTHTHTHTHTQTWKKHRLLDSWKLFANTVVHQITKILQSGQEAS